MLFKVRISPIEVVEIVIQFSNISKDRKGKGLDESQPSPLLSRRACAGRWGEHTDSGPGRENQVRWVTQASHRARTTERARHVCRVVLGYEDIWEETHSVL